MKEEFNVPDLVGFLDLADKHISPYRIRNDAAEFLIDQVLPLVSQHLCAFPVYCQDAQGHEIKREYSCL